MGAKARAAAARGQPVDAGGWTAKLQRMGISSPMGWGVGVALAAVLLVLLPVLPRLLLPAELQPLRAPLLSSLPEFGGEYRDRMMWGSYRPGLYFGMRTRTPKGLISGLMWFDPDSPNTLMEREIRHAALEEDKLSRYGWVRHDGEQYGRQIIVDKDYNLTLTMVKHWGPDSGPAGDWAVRVQVHHSEGKVKKRRRVSLTMYLADEDAPKAPWSTLPYGEPSDLQEGVHLLSGSSSAVGPWSFHVVESARPPDATSSRGKRFARPARLDYLTLHGQEGEHDLKLAVREVLMSILYEQYERNPTPNNFRLYLPNGATTGSDLALFQMTVTLPGSADFVFLSHKEGGGGAGGASEQERAAGLSGDALTRIIAAHEQRYDQHFEEVFAPEGSVPLPEEESEMAKAAVSNLVGSMGYFYGSSQVRMGDEVRAGWPAPLFTAVPSRSFFPRGFLWDEGFHQMLVQRWSPRLSRDAIAHWLDLMNTQGWIPREQILGAEARTRVPDEFVVQDPTHANPPSLFLPIAAMARQLQGAKEGEDLEAVRAFVSAAWPRLEAWYSWFNTTQAGSEPTAYRWHGRNATTEAELNPKTLASGLDDFPRASHPGPEERHLDLRCWMALASEAMATIGTSLGLPEQVVEPYVATHRALSDMATLDSLHWDPTSEMYLDWGMHTEDVKLQRQKGGAPAKRVVGTPPEPRHVPHFGYVSLFPLLMRLLPADSPRLGATLAHLTDPDLLWTEFGLRSLAAASSIYNKDNTPSDQPYWRGAVWVNVNYLALRALRHYADQEGPFRAQAAEAYAKLRAHLLTNMAAQYEAHGYLYEQYNDATGRGSGSHPFNGWSALVALVAVEA